MKWQFDDHEGGNGDDHRGGNLMITSGGIAVLKRLFSFDTSNNWHGRRSSEAHYYLVWLVLLRGNLSFIGFVCLMTTGQILDRFEKYKLPSAFLYEFYPKPHRGQFAKPWTNTKLLLDKIHARVSFKKRTPAPKDASS